MEISYIPAPPGDFSVADQRIEVEVNGHKTVLKDIEKDRTKGLCRISVPIELDPGYNRVTIGSSYTWAPDIDCFRLKKL